MYNIQTLLRSGGRYTVDHVIQLYDLCSMFIHSDFRFYCYTDIDINLFPCYINTVKLNRNWPGWWSKLEIFSQENFFAGKKLYLDLDTLIIKEIDPIFELDCKIPIFSGKENSTIPVSCTILWETEMSYLYDKAVPAMKHIGVNHVNWNDFPEDFKFMRHQFKQRGVQIKTFNTVIPDEVVVWWDDRWSLEESAKFNKNIPDKAKIITFLKPWDEDYEIVYKQLLGDRNGTSN